MGTHKNAALTVRQREAVQLAGREGTASRRQLARRYGVSLTTIQRWAPRLGGQDRPLGRPVGTGTPVPDYEAAVLVERIRHPTHGPVRIAHDLRPRFARAHRGTVLALLQAHRLTRGTRPKKATTALAGGEAPGADGRAVSAQTAAGQGVDYKISVIHLATRLKYREIHDNQDSATVA